MNEKMQKAFNIYYCIGKTFQIIYQLSCFVGHPVHLRRFTKKIKRRVAGNLKEYSLTKLSEFLFLVKYICVDLHKKRELTQQILVLSKNVLTSTTLPQLGSGLKKFKQVSTLNRILPFLCWRLLEITLTVPFEGIVLI